MNEARNFLRHVLPGIVYAVELLILLSLSFELNVFIQFLVTISDILTIASVIALLLLFGGIGFIFSIIHHVFYWLIYRGVLISFGSNYMDMLTKNVQEGRLKLILLGEKSVENVYNRKIHKLGEWRIVNSIWYTRKELSDIVKGSIERNSLTWDIAHSNGATLIGSIVAFLSWILLINSECLQKHEISIVMPICSAFIFIIIHGLSYYRTINLAVGFPKIILSNDLYAYERDTGKPFELIVTEDDLHPK